MAMVDEIKKALAGGENWITTPSIQENLPEWIEALVEYYDASCVDDWEEATEEEFERFHAARKKLEGERGKVKIL